MITMAKKHDIRIDRNKLHPLLNYRLGLFLDKCEKKGYYLIVTEGFRTKDYQDELYAKGRSKPGNIVTSAKGSDYASQHQWGVAFDVALNFDVDKDGKVTDDMWNANGYKKIAKIAKSVGLKWGGDWTSFVDNPHFYLGKWGSTTKKLKEKYRTPLRFKSTWKAKTTKAINLYKGKSMAKKIRTIVKNENVRVLFRKFNYAKVEYDGIYGYVRKKYLK